MSLDTNFYTVKNALLWGNCAEHFKNAAHGNLGHRAVHYIIAFIEITPVISQIISLFEMIIAKCVLKPAEVTEVEATPDPEEQADIIARMAELDQYLQTSAGSLSLEESDTLETQNERWKKEIEEIASTITLPKLSLNRDIIDEISAWDDEFIKKVISGEENAPSLEHFETVVYTEAMRADKNRETEIIPHVFVGDSYSLEALKKENKLKFGSVIIMTTKKRVNFDIQGITGYVFEIQNEAQRFAENATEFKKFFKHIDKARQEKRPILLQCHQGKITSVGLIVAYLSDRLNLATEDAHQYVKTKRLIASLTPKMLIALERLKTPE